MTNEEKPSDPSPPDEVEEQKRERQTLRRFLFAVVAATALIWILLFLFAE